MKLNDLRRQRASAFDEMEKLTGVEEWDEDTRQQFEDLKSRVDVLDADIKRLEEFDVARRDLDKPVPTPGLELGDGPEDRGFKNMGECARAIIVAGTPGGDVDPRLVGMSHRAASGLSEAVPADGGFLLEESYVQGIMGRVYDQSGVLSRVRRIPVSANSNSITLKAVDESSRVDGSRLGGVRGYWAAEAGTVTATDPAFRDMRLELNKLMAICYLTDELLEDVAALNSFIPGAFADELEFKLVDAIINGDGVGKPKGIMNSAALVEASEDASQATTTFTAGNAANMFTRLWARSRPQAVWLINQDVEPQLWQMEMGSGYAAVFLPPGGYSVAPYGSIFGRPIVPIEQCQTLGTVGDVILVDLSQYVLATKGGMDGAWSMHVRFLYGEQTFRITLRVDGQPAWHSALTPFKGTNTISPYVVVETRDG